MDEIARILAYNVVNFSFFADPGHGDRTWFIGETAVDDEALDIVESLKRYEREVGNPSQWLDGDFLANVSLKTVKHIFRRNEKKCECDLPLIELRKECLNALGRCYQMFGGSLENFLRFCAINGHPDRSAVRPTPEFKIPGAKQEAASGEEAFKPNAVPFEDLQFSVGRFVKCLAYFCPAFRDVRGPRMLGFAPAGLRQEIVDGEFDGKKFVAEIKEKWLESEFKEKEKIKFNMDKMREFVETQTRAQVDELVHTSVAATQSELGVPLETLFEYRRYDVEFAKRPQLCISMLHGDKLLDFADRESSMTVFSDYRLPQLFLGTGIFEAAPALEKIISEKGWLYANTFSELALRAATIVAAEELQSALTKVHGKALEDGGIGKSVPIADLDYFLWQYAVAKDKSGEIGTPFHRCRTFCY